MAGKLFDHVFMHFYNNRLLYSCYFEIFMQTLRLLDTFFVAFLLANWCFPKDHFYLSFFFIQYSLMKSLFLPYFYFPFYCQISLLSLSLSISPVLFVESLSLLHLAKLSFPFRNEHILNGLNHYYNDYYHSNNDDVVPNILSVAWKFACKSLTHPLNSVGRIPRPFPGIFPWVERELFGRTKNWNQK